MIETPLPPTSEPYSSNAVRLSIREWAALSIALVAVAAFAGDVWRGIEPLSVGPDGRVPYAFSEDYWLVERLCDTHLRQATRSGSAPALVFGDSVIWGQYVNGDRTLTSHMNRLAGAARFVNMGLDGAHPLALRGLLEHACPLPAGAEVVVHLNLLWLSSPQSDLQVGRDGRLNHSRLLPQFAGRPPAYAAPISERLGVVVSRTIPALEWSRHLQMAYFDDRDLTRRAIAPAPAPSPAPGAPPRNLPWVALEASLQWRAFTELVSDLAGCGVRVTAIVGPLNEHLLSEADVHTYRALVTGATRWLQARGIPWHAPDALPAELYADLSHPVAAGYELLARRLLAAGVR
jgi:hypothetical protein